MAAPYLLSPPLYRSFGVVPGRPLLSTGFFHPLPLEDEPEGYATRAASEEIREATATDRFMAIMNLGRYVVTVTLLLYANLGSYLDSDECYPGGGTLSNGIPSPPSPPPPPPPPPGSHTIDPDNGNIACDKMSIEDAQAGLAFFMLIFELCVFCYCAYRRRHFPGSHYENVHTLVYNKVLSEDFPGTRMSFMCKFLMGLSGYFVIISFILDQVELESNGEDSWSLRRLSLILGISMGVYKNVLCLVLLLVFYLNVISVVTVLIMYQLVFPFVKCYYCGDERKANVTMRSCWLVPRLYTEEGDPLWRMYLFLYREFNHSFPGEHWFVHKCLSAFGRTDQGRDPGDEDTHLAPTSSCGCPGPMQGSVGSVHQVAVGYVPPNMVTQMPTQMPTQVPMQVPMQMPMQMQNSCHGQRR